MSLHLPRRRIMPVSTDLDAGLRTISRRDRTGLSKNPWLLMKSYLRPVGI